jgi:DNA repair protein RadA/Sms
VAKEKNIFECNACGKTYSKWLGKCSTCGEWNSIVEIKEEKTSLKKISSSKTYKLSEIGTVDVPRFYTGSKELDRVLGGGIVKGASILLGGEPGIGKSTLLLEVSNKVKCQKILYVSGEESLEQLKLRSKRLGVTSNKLLIMSETSLLKVLKTIKEESPDLVIIDSIQAIYDSELNSPMGSFSQLRRTVSTIVELIKQKDIPTFLVGHVTKEGMIAGPKLIEHMVDAVIYFEGDDNINYRVLRTIKNRFGPTNEIGLFEMTEKGLVDVENPSMFFISTRDKENKGSSVGCVIAGSRPILIESQCLLSSTYSAMPRRTIVGYDPNRVAMLLAIMEKFLHYSFSNLDLFVNIVGGIKISETSLDLAVILSIASSYLSKNFKEDYVFIGEVGLTGEIRPVPRTLEKVKEAKRLGFKNVLIPKLKTQKTNIDLQNDINLIQVKNIKEVFDVVFT